MTSNTKLIISACAFLLIIALTSCGHFMQNSDEEVIESIHNTGDSHQGNFPIPVNRENGFYEVVQHEPSDTTTDIKLKEQPAMTFNYISKIKKTYSRYGDKLPEINITLTNEGAEKFHELTKVNIGNPIAIVVEKQIISMPIVNMEITEGKVSINGNFSEDEINTLIEKIKKRI